MFSSLVRGSGTWDGRLDLFDEEFDESSVAVLFPSIAKTSKSADNFYQQNVKTAELTSCNQPEEANLTRLPKTYLTRKGAIVLYTSLHQAKHNESQQNCEQNYNDVGCHEVKKLSKQGQHQNYKYISRNQKGKLLNFLDAFTSGQPVDGQTISEHDLGNLSYQRRHSSVGSRYRPKTVPPGPKTVPPEPEHPKAHPRITSAKPSPPTRALGKLQFKNVCSQFVRDVSPIGHRGTGDAVTHPSLSEAAQVIDRDQTSNTVTASELVPVYRDRIRIPRPPSEGQSEHTEGVSRVSSASRYSSWCTRDDASLSFYDDDLKPSTNTKQDYAPKEDDFNAEFGEDVPRWHGGHRGSLSGTVGEYSRSRPVSSLWSSVWENSSDNGISKVEDNQEYENASFLGNGGGMAENSLGNGPRPTSSRSQVCSSEKGFQENENASFLGNGGGMAEDCLGNDPRPASSRSQVCSSKHDFAENDDVPFLGNGGGTTEHRLRDSPRPKSSKTEHVRSRNGSGRPEDFLESTPGPPEHSQFCSRKDDSALDNNSVSQTDGRRNASDYRNFQVGFAEQELQGFGNTFSQEKDGDCGRDAPCSESSQVHSVKQAFFIEETNVFETDEIKDTCSVSGTRYARTSPDSRNSQFVSSKRAFQDYRNVSSVETVARVNRVKSAPCSRENSDARRSQESHSPRKSFSAGFFRSLSTDTYTGINTISTTPPQISVRVPSVTSVNETYADDEEEVFSLTEDVVLGHSDVVEPNMEHFDSTGKIEPSNEQNLVQPVSPAPVMVSGDNDNGDEPLDRLPSETAERHNASGSSLVTDDEAQHAQGVDIAENTQLLGEAQVEHSDDDDGNLFEATNDIPYATVQLKVEPTELEEKTAVEKVTKPSIESRRNSNSPQQSEKFLGNPPKENEKRLANSAKVNQKLPVVEKARKITKPKEMKTPKAKKKDEHLDVQGVGNTEAKILEGKEKAEVNIKTKVDLSDLKRSIGKNSTTKPDVTNKKPFAKKSRSPKRSRKKNYLPEDTETNLDVIPTIDNNLLKVLENQDGDIELSEEALNQFAPVENFRDPDLAAFPEEKSTNTGTHSPSKVRKSTKKGTTRKRKDSTALEKNKEAEERRKKILEEKEKREDELRLLKEREEKQSRLHEEVKEKQRTIEEEREKRLQQEAQARKLEEEAEAELRETRWKAKEEREKRREEEAERRRKEVQRKREEKRSRELEIQKKEQELERQRDGREHAELQAQREREKELEKMAEEERKEEERLRLLELEEERKAEEERIHEAEEALQQMVREREYREQMRKIAEAQQAKLEKEETERVLREQEELAAIEEERARIEREREERENEERARIRELRKHDAIARIRAAHEASKRRAWALQRREKNVDRMAHLRCARQSQRFTDAFTFSYHVHVPRKVWELPYNWNSKKERGFRPPARKKKPSKVE